MRSTANGEAIQAERAVQGAERTRVVYTQPPLQLARLIAEEEGGFRVELGGGQHVLPAASDVDPALLREVVARQGRVLVETHASDGSALIAGVVQVRRTLEIDEHGDVVASLRSLRLKARQEIQLTTERALVWIKGEDVELYGKEVLTRAREVAKILGRLISLN